LVEEVYGAHGDRRVSITSPLYSKLLAIIEVNIDYRSLALTGGDFFRLALA
jgi:hypothetical protein